MKTGKEQATVLERRLSEEIGDPRFVRYLQVHEYEALVLVDPRRITTLYDDPSNAEMDALCGECQSSTRLRTSITASTRIPNTEFSVVSLTTTKTLPDHY